jgi:hypothetical protein
MDTPPVEKLKIDFHSKHIQGTLCVFDFIDNGHHIAYMPSLSLTGYGDNVQEAHDLLINSVVKDFFEGLFSLTEEQINTELKNLGWKKSLFFKKDFSKSAHIDKEGVLRDFNLPAETEINSELLAVA